MDPSTIAGLVSASGMGLGAIGSAFGRARRKKKRQREYGAIAEAGGLANYKPETLGKLADTLPEQGGLSYYKRLLEGFPGNEQNLIDYLQRFPDLINAGITAGVQGELQGSDAYKYLQDFRNVSDPMQAYGVGAGQIAQSGQEAFNRGAMQLQRAGLGRSAALSSLASQTAQAAGNQQSDLYTRLYQQKLAGTAAAAREAFDLQRQIATLALGAAPTPRVPPQERPNLWGQIAPLLGQSLGSWLGNQAGAGAKT